MTTEQREDDWQHQKIVLRKAFVKTAYMNIPNDGISCCPNSILVRFLSCKLTPTKVRSKVTFTWSRHKNREKYVARYISCILFHYFDSLENIMDDLIYVYDTISQISTNVYIDNLHYHLLKCCRLKPSKSLEWVFLKTQIRMFCESECNQCIPCPWGGPVWDTKGQVLWIRGEREAHSDCSSFLQYDGQHPPAH